MINIDEICQAHRDCRCIETGSVVEAGSDLRRIVKDGCSLHFLGLQLAIDCDKCIAFAGETRPDLIVLQKHSDSNRWLIVEIKTSFHSRSVLQMRSAIEILDIKRYYFDLHDQTAIEIVFAQIKRLREADIQRYRRKSFEFRGRQLMIRVVQCGGDQPV